MFIKPQKCLGVGINYRNEISQDILKNIHCFDFIEVGTERFLSEQTSTFNKVIHSIPVVLHGLSFSTETNSDKAFHQYLENIESVLKKVNCEWFSEHIAATNVNGIEMRGLMPVEFSYGTIEKFVYHIKQIMALTDKPFLVENITYYYAMPNGSLSELNFINEILERANCGLLLDLNNLYVNSVNHKYNPYDFIRGLPLERVMEIHLAGCNYLYGMLVDTHASSIKKEVLSLFEFICQHTQINGVIIERDDRLYNFQELLDEVDIVKKILNKYQPLKH